MVQGAVTGGKPMAGNFRTLPGPPLPPAAGAVNSVTARSGQARRSEADPAAAQRPPAHNAAAPAAQPWMNCICVPASSIKSPLASGAVSVTSGTPLMLGRLAPSTWAST